MTKPRTVNYRGNRLEIAENKQTHRVELVKIQRGPYLHVEVEGDQETLKQLSIWMDEAIQLMSEGFKPVTVVTNKVRNQVR